MAQAIWKGSISFGLVHVPVALYSGEKRHQLDLTMLDRRDYSPIGYKRVNKNTGESVEWNDIVKGYEYEKGDFVLLSDEDFRQANVEATRTVEIVDFVDASEIPPTYFDRPYFLEPLPRGEKAYALLRETLRRTGKAGVGKVVLRNRQHLAVLLPLGNMLMVDLLRFPDELRSAEGFKVPQEDLDTLGITPKELAMAEQLVESMAEPWKPERYHDDYREDLMRRIEEKIQRGETHVLLEPVPEEAVPRVAEVIDLMAQLKKSVEARRKEREKQPEAKAGGGPKRPRKRA